MIDLLLIWIDFRQCFADTFGDDFGIALGVAGVFAVCTLHACRVLEEFSAKSTPHDIVKLLLDEFVALFLNDIFFFLSYSTLSIETEIHGSSTTRLLLKAHSQVYPTSWL